MHDFIESLTYEQFRAMQAMVALFQTLYKNEQYDAVKARQMFDLAKKSVLGCDAVLEDLDKPR
jgi:hypothetical protein